MSQSEPKTSSGPGWKTDFYKRHRSIDQSPLQRATRGKPDQPLRSTVIGSYPFPSWLELASTQLDRFGTDDREELVSDAVRIAIGDQLDAGLDVITDGEQTRLDFNLSFYGFLQGIELESASPRQIGRAHV